MISLRSLTTIAAGLLIGVSAQAANLTPEQESLAKIVEFGGSMHAMAQACGDYGDEQLKKMKAEQKAASSTLPEAQFDALFKAGYEKTQRKIAQGTAAQKQGMCQQFQAMQAGKPGTAPRK